MCFINSLQKSFCLALVDSQKYNYSLGKVKIFKIFLFLK